MLQMFFCAKKHEFRYQNKTKPKTMKGKPRRDWLEFNIISRRGSGTYKDSCRAWGPDLIGLIVQKD